MIPLAQIIQWRQTAPWTDDMQVEQDLILSRAIVEIFSNPFLADQLAFRGGTALHKLFFSPAARYSEDIDLVRTSKGGIKEIIDALRDCLEPWLGQPKTRQTGQSFKLFFYFNPEISASSKQKIKVEINIHENFSILDRLSKPFTVKSDWFNQDVEVNTFQLEELLATKLRALYERKKGRDAFDLWLAIKEQDFDPAKTMAVFSEYMTRGNKTITKKLFVNNLDLKLQDSAFLDDIEPLLAPRLKNNHSRPLGFITEGGQGIATEGWSLLDAVETIKYTLIDQLN
ncbi:TPA: nucleotidyl transferase AbiEii/AbiGii toxin family protein [Legionella pneumophila subsp. pneumophila]|nr:nucleotidyl transferase AbiEii/AbiGii toxin family protein [Legionella pneumophila subsp. pneumophila]